MNMNSCMKMCSDCGGGLPVGSRCLRCEPCKKQRAVKRVREWREANPEKSSFQRKRALPRARVRAKEWYEANRERALTSRKNWREANPERMLAYHIQWLAKPGSKLKAHNWTQVWMRAHPEKVRAYYKRWYVENQDTLRELSVRRERAYSSSTFCFEDWLSILEVFCHRCAYCLRSDVKLTMDHVQPISKGGLHVVGNVVPACKSCNSRKNNRPVFVMLSGREKQPIAA